MPEPDPQEQQERQSYDRWTRPPALSNLGYVLAVLIPLLIAAGAFGVVSLNASGGDTGSGITVRLPVSAWAPGSAPGATPIEGVLAVDSDHCVYLAPAPGGDQPSDQPSDQPGKVWPVWPSGYHATLDDNNRLSLYDANGKVVAVDGDRLRMSGDQAPVGSFSTEPCLPPDGDVAVVQSDVTVVR